MTNQKKYIFWSIAAIFIFILWAYQYKITVNIPWWDDFHGIILPVFHLFSEISLIEKFKLFFSLNNEHRVVNDRIFLLVIYLISGTFQLKTLALLGYINLIIIFLVLVKVSKSLVRNVLFLTPLIFLIFQAQYYESLQSLMVPFQNFSVILYVFLTFFFLIFRKDKSIFLALLFGILAILSHGNGILALLIGMIILLFNERYKQLGIWTLVSTITIALYFWGYKKPDWNSGVSPTEHPFEALKYVFEFFGAYALNFTDLSATATAGNLKHIVPQAFGLVLIGLFIVIFFKKYPIISKDWKLATQRLRHSKNDQFLITIFGFIFATGLMIGISRTGFSMLSRYTINSAFLVIVVYLFLVSNTKHSKLIAISSSIVTFFILGLTYYNTFDIAIFKKNNSIADGINFQKTGSWISQYSDSSHVMKLNPLLVEPLKAKKYIFPKSDLENYTTIIPQNTFEKLDISIVDSYLEIKANSQIKYDHFNGENGIYFSLENDKFKFVFPGYNQKNTVKKFLTTFTYFSDDHRTSFPLSCLPRGEYKIFLITKNGSEIKKFDLQKTYGPNPIIK